MVGIPTIGLFFYNHGVGKPMGGGFFDGDVPRREGEVAHREGVPPRRADGVTRSNAPLAHTGMGFLQPLFGGSCECIDVTG